MLFLTKLIGMFSSSLSSLRSSSLPREYFSLFELGFAPQLHEILHKLPPGRQTLLFSATLPKLLVDFARAGLTDPLLLRLDVDTKIPSDLEMMFFSIQSGMKDAALLYTLKYLIPKNEMTIIFVATKHHVEYVNQMLSIAGFSTTYIYGSLDQQARKMHLNRFRMGQVKIMVVTDVAARGIDIPLLDHVINYDFPGQSKIFVHRVGRVARAGRKGTAWSFVSTEESAYMLDFQLFAGRALSYNVPSERALEVDYTQEIVFGSLPQSCLDAEKELTRNLISHNSNLETALQSVENATKLYIKTRPLASRESYKRAKQLPDFITLHPILTLKQNVSTEEMQREDILKAISSFRPTETIFEVGKRGMKDEKAVLMSKRRNEIGGSIEKRKVERKEMSDSRLAAGEVDPDAVPLEMADEDMLVTVFGEKGPVTHKDKDEPSAKKRKTSTKTKVAPDSYKDTEFYVPSVPSDLNTERGYSMQTRHHSGFNESASKAMINLQGDDVKSFMQVQSSLKWDKRKRKFVKEQVGSDNIKRIRTDAGLLVNASYKSNRYGLQFVFFFIHIIPRVNNPSSDFPGKVFIVFFGGILSRSINQWSLGYIAREDQREISSPVLWHLCLH